MGALSFQKEHMLCPHGVQLLYMLERMPNPRSFWQSHAAYSQHLSHLIPAGAQIALKSGRLQVITLHMQPSDSLKYY